MQPTPLKSLDASSRSDLVAAKLREAIIEGQLPPGHRLTEADLAEQLGTSRAPVREALQRLEQEGLVVSYPYRGTEVVGIQQEEIDQILVPIRLVLERYAAAKIIATASDEALDELALRAERMRTAGRQGDRRWLADEDIKFHESMIQLAGQHHCLQVWRTIQPRVHLYFRRDAESYQDPTVVADQHDAVVAALRGRDPIAVDDAITDHIRTHTPPSKP